MFIGVLLLSHRQSQNALQWKKLIILTQWKRTIFIWDIKIVGFCWRRWSKHRKCITISIVFYRQISKFLFQLTTHTPNHAKQLTTDLLKTNRLHRFLTLHLECVCGTETCDFSRHSFQWFPSDNRDISCVAFQKNSFRHLVPQATISVLFSAADGSVLKLWASLEGRWGHLLPEADVRMKLLIFHPADRQHTHRLCVSSVRYCKR